MTNPTSNFGWQMPTSTDLVTDLPADFEVFGQAVDTSLADLKGGTTGQILSKTTDANMDFTWVSANPGDITGVTAGTGISGGGTSGDVTVTNSMATAIDAKGDLIGGTGADTFARLAVGANDTVLTADSTAATGLKWATPASGGMTLLSTTTLSGTSTVISSISQAYQDLYVLINNPFRNASFDSGGLRVNPNSTTLLFTGLSVNGTTNTDSVLANLNGPDLGTTSAPATNNAFLYIRNYASTTNAKSCFFSMSYASQSSRNQFGFLQTASAISSLQITNQGNSMQYSGGTVLIYGVK